MALTHTAIPASRVGAGVGMPTSVRGDYWQYHAVSACACGGPAASPRSHGGGTTTHRHGRQPQICADDVEMPAETITLQGP
jgi:hypothetical protein